MSNAKQEIITAISEILGIIGGSKMLVEAYRKVLQQSGAWCHAREGLWDTWCQETRECGTVGNVEEGAVLWPILIGVNNVESPENIFAVLEDFQNRGPELALARFLEAVFQFHTQHGLEYEQAFNELVQSRLSFALADLKFRTWEKLSEFKLNNKK